MRLCRLITAVNAIRLVELGGPLSQSIFTAFALLRARTEVVPRFILASRTNVTAPVVAQLGMQSPAHLKSEFGGWQFG